MTPSLANVTSRKTPLSGLYQTAGVARLTNGGKTPQMSGGRERGQGEERRPDHPSRQSVGVSDTGGMTGSAMQTRTISKSTSRPTLYRLARSGDLPARSQRSPKTDFHDATQGPHMSLPRSATYLTFNVPYAT